MIFSQDRGTLRRMYQQAWQKRCAGQLLEPLEAQIADVIAMHPEYHTIIESPDVDALPDYAPAEGQSNPFLHMGLHLALTEQLSTDRPAGIRGLFHSARSASGDEHATAHQFIECLAEALWQAQRDNKAPDEAAYLEALRQLTT